MDLIVEIWKYAQIGEIGGVIDKLGNIEGNAF
jgi:hypothetical protein